ncbi:pyridoxal phosphate-dependent aminotransferase [Acinetobacter sichuanensis]|uniref:Aminotransferase n=1 Tax=Acinetobacter sichuanensis TaxID=2136183 RepID=A0A371YQZ2_9GAMM|nr:pyridoxal phosphate-dependent aminotransferase [Acinetobacter sichuanensis]RFC83872.1 pyridoxal phosphate-dependent aminotransferase [Acinetobacter sichuanensis]
MQFQSTRVQKVKSSPSMVVSVLAKQMAAAGEPVINLSLGEPDFSTPTHVVDAAYKAMLDGHHLYTAPNGYSELRDAIVEKFKRDNNLDYSQDEICIGNGAKQIIFNAFLATLESGDEVITPAPYWVSYTDMALLNGGVPKVLSCGTEQNFKVQPEQLEQAITSKTRWIMLNSPSNPTGVIYSKDELAALGKVLERHPNIFILSDEIYEHIILSDKPFVSFAEACPTLKNRTLIVNGVSKAYAMTGFRLGYAAGPKELIAAMNKMQSQTTTCPSSVSQQAAIAALNGPQDFIAESTKEYRERGQMVTQALSEIKGLELKMPEGAFYAFPKCEGFIGKKTPKGDVIKNDTDLANYLLQEGKVATIPGVAFGIEPYIRLSFATSQKKLQQALTQLRSALAALV